MKKKIVLMATSLVLVAALAVGGTLAWLTDTKTVENTFTVGNISMTLDEAKVDANGNKITPEVRTSEGEGNDYKVYPSALVDKDPTVTINAKSDACYVRMLVTVTESSKMDTIFAPGGANLNGIFLGYNGSNWTYIDDTEDVANDTRTYEFRYKTVVPYSETATKLPALFTQVKIPDTLTEDDLANIPSTGFKIKVVAHAIQSAGFANESAAWAAFDEQNP